MSDTDLKATPGNGQPPADEASAERLTSAPVESEAPTGIGVFGWLRWTWRQLTSMRVALILLFLLSVAAIPGSLIPQTAENAFQVQTWQAAHKDLTPIYQKLQLFNVYSSVWFSAIYILLFVSLAGCIIPRTWQFVGVLRAKPPAAPANLTRMPVYAAWHTDADPATAVAAAQRPLRRRRFRVHGSGSAVAGEKGYLREVGNLLFHLSLFALLAGFAWASLASGTGGKLVIEGDGYTNTLTQMDDFNGSAFYGPNDLDPFGFHLDNFTATYQLTGDQMGQPRTFDANVHYWTGSDPTRTKGGVISVNHPLEIGGSKVFLIGHGYAPVITVKDGSGKVVYHDAVPFLPQDPNLTSTGVVKVGDYGQKDGKKVQLGFSGFFLPTAPDSFGPTTGPRSLFPGDANPAMVLTAYEGDLGTDSGVPQNIYQLDLSHLTQLQQDGQPARTKLTPGQGWTLPDGYGSISFDGYKQWASFSVSHRPGNTVALTGAMLAILGLIGSLLVQRRRIWVRAVTTPDGRTLVELAGLARSESAKIAEELADLAVDLQDDAPALDEPEEPEETDASGASAEPDEPDGPSESAAPDTPADATPSAPETKE